MTKACLIALNMFAAEILLVCSIFINNEVLANPLIIEIDNNEVYEFLPDKACDYLTVSASPLEGT